MQQGLKSELEKILKKIDQRISGHSKLHDHYKRLTQVSEYLLMGAAIILTITGIADDSYYTYVGLYAKETRFWFGIYSVISLVISIIAWKIDWRDRAVVHRNARDKLSLLKLECRQALSDTDMTGEDLKKISDKSSITQSELEPIPERYFNSLKAWHLRKVALSQFSSQHAGKPYWLIWILFNFKTIFSKGNKIS